MSFTSNIKTEISNIEYNKAENISELSAFLNIVATITDESIALYIENLSVSRRIYKLIKDLYHINITMEKIQTNRLNKKTIMKLEVKENINNILNELDLVTDDGNRKYIPSEYVYSDPDLTKAYLRGVFFACGSINDPKTSRYHAEFIIENKETATFVNDLLNKNYFNSKMIKHQKNYMVYIKESERISDFIKLLNAPNALFYYEDIRIYRDHKNMSNRLNNCEQANTDKIIFSSNEQLENIRKLKEKIDFDSLDDKLKVVCIYKEKYPESSMEELANIISFETQKKVTKSCINHRLRKIKELANNWKILKMLLKYEI